MDNKYGRIFTESDVRKVIEYVIAGDYGPDQFPDILAEMDGDQVRFKWEEDEPVFVLRARDNTAEGAIRFYRDHQRPGAPPNHLDAIERACTAFREFRADNPHLMKDPD